MYPVACAKITFSYVTLQSLPVHILVADGDCWKLQIVLVFHVDVNVRRERQE